MASLSLCEGGCAPLLSASFPHTGRALATHFVYLGQVSTCRFVVLERTPEVFNNVSGLWLLESLELWQQTEEEVTLSCPFDEIILT